MESFSRMLAFKFSNFFLVLHRQYNSSMSDSYTSVGDPFEINYASGSMKGFTSMDNVGVSLKQKNYVHFQ